MHFLTSPPRILISCVWGVVQAMGVFKASGVVPSGFANFWSNPVNIILFPLPELCLQGCESITNQWVTNLRAGHEILWAKDIVSDICWELLRGKKNLPFSLRKFSEVVATLTKSVAILPSPWGWGLLGEGLIYENDREESKFYVAHAWPHLCLGALSYLNQNIMYCLCHLKFNFLPTWEHCNECGFPWHWGLRHWYGLICFYKPAAFFI